MRFSVRGIVEATMGGDYHPYETYRALCALADDLNTSLLYYEVTLEHFDTRDFLRFEKRIAEEIADIEHIMEVNLGKGGDI